MRVLIAGVDPLWGVKKSPSAELAKLWQEGSLSVPNAEVKGVVISNKFQKGTEELCAEIASFKPHIVLMYGTNQKNDPIRLERFAVNVECSPSGDNTKIPVKERHIIQGGPAAYEATLPIADLMKTLLDHGVHCVPSYHAGTHTSNSLMYGVLHWITSQSTDHPVAAGFVTVPYPNELGVIEDESWATVTLSEIVQSSLVLAKASSDWYESIYNTEGIE